MAKSQNNIQIITFNGSVILGNIATAEGVTTISNSMTLGPVSQVTKKHLADYMCAENLGKLDKDITVSGAGGVFSVRELDDDLALELQILKLKFAQAEGSAVAKLVNNEFKSLIG